MFEPHREYWVVSFAGSRTYVTAAVAQTIVEIYKHSCKGTIIEFYDILGAKNWFPAKKFEGAWHHNDEIESKYHIQEKFNEERTKALKIDVGGWLDE